MALRSSSAMTVLQSILAGSHAPLRSAFVEPLLRPLPSILPPIRIPAALASISVIPSLLGGLWESILRAVPKKKTSHMKKRHRQMAGKALKDVTAMSRCSSCGRVKLAHVLCPYCVAAVMEKFKQMGIRKQFQATPLDKSHKFEGSNAGGRSQSSSSSSTSASA